MNKSKNESKFVFQLIGDWGEQLILLKNKFLDLPSKDLKLEPVKEPVKEPVLFNREGIKLDKKRSEVISLLKNLKP